MRLYISESKTSKILYVIKSFRKEGKSTSKIVERLGTYEEIQNRLNGADPIVWAKQYVQELNEKEKLQKRDVVTRFSADKQVKMERKLFYNGGYLFLQQIYYKLGLDKICEEIEDRYDFTFSLNAILSRLIFSRILYPFSDENTLELSSNFVEKPLFTQDELYQSIGVLSKEADYILASIYKHCSKLFRRKLDEVVYDYSNFYFSFENQSSSQLLRGNNMTTLSRVALYLDEDGLPLLFKLVPRALEDDYITLMPLEKILGTDFEHSKLMTYSDASFFLPRNRKNFETPEGDFISAQSIGDLRPGLREWAYDPTGWQLKGSNILYDIRALDNEKDIDKIFFKERWRRRGGIKQRLIILFSLKHKFEIQHLRQQHIERYQKLISEGVLKMGHRRVMREEQNDGFFAICTNTERDIPYLVNIAINHRNMDILWGNMKSEFKTNVVRLQKNERFKAHFLVCFLSQMIYRLLNNSLGNKYSYQSIRETLSNMIFFKIEGEGYIPAYNRNELTDNLHKVAGFHTDYEIVSNRTMKNIIFAATEY